MSKLNIWKLMTTNIKYSTSNIMRIILFLLPIICFTGCYSTESVNIKVKVNPKVDMSKYKAIAVIDFLDKKSKPNVDQGKIISRMIKKQLKKSEEFQILDEKSMELNNDIHEDDIKDPSSLVSLGSQLGVDALIIGEFEFSQRYQSVPYIVDRYSSNERKYVPEGNSYIRNVYSFSFHAKVIDGKTGETIFDYSPRTEEKPDYQSSGLGLLFSDGTNDPASLRAIALKPITNFVLSLTPHYENERRIVIR
ncbi:MAG: TolB protein [Candidatus Poribacteria bacterium]|nr:TolB protein [Candidatus Poribacteria bacterium]